MAKRAEKRERRSMVLQPDAAGIDIGAEEIFVAVPPDRDEESTRRFSNSIMCSATSPEPVAKKASESQPIEAHLESALSAPPALVN